MNSLKQKIKETDLTVLLICMGLSFFSVISIYSIYAKMTILNNIRVVIVQAGASAVGVVAAFLISLIDYKEMCEMWKLHSAFAYALMVLTAVIGFAPEGTTNKAWIALPFGLSIQPSEILKLSMILTLAFFFEKNKNNVNEIKTFSRLVFAALVPLAFVAYQKDDGTLLIFCVIVACIFFARGVSYKVVAAGVVGLAAMSPILWFKVLDDYQKNRILALFHPDEFSNIMWQQNQGRIAIGSGMITGKGFLVDNHNATPLAYNDSIFSFCAESTGFVGTVLLLATILFLWMKILSIARRSNDLRGSLICVGVFAMLMAQTAINIGMNLSLLPVIGVTLPLFSAGGTSVIVTYAAIGLVLSVARHNPKTLFN